MTEQMADFRYSRTGEQWIREVWWYLMACRETTQQASERRWFYDQKETLEWYSEVYASSADVVEKVCPKHFVDISQR